MVECLNQIYFKVLDIKASITDRIINGDILCIKKKFNESLEVLQSKVENAKDEREKQNYQTIADEFLKAINAYFSLIHDFLNKNKNLHL